jgi:hypothetical protein
MTYTVVLRVLRVESFLFFLRALRVLRGEAVL